MAEFKVGSPVQVAATGVGNRVPVMRILGRNAGPMTGPGTNTYLIGKQRLTLVDPGPADEVHIQSLMQAIGDRRLERILVTHTHGDHSPAATPLRDITGAALVGIAAPSSSRNDRTFVPDREYHGGEILDCDEFSIELIHTPGHVSNHFCYLLIEQKLLFTGDHILQGTTSVILPPDGDMSDYMNSLQNLLSRELAYLAPGHGDIITEPGQAIEALIAHRTGRENKILATLESLGETDLDKLTSRVYDDVAAHLLPWARLTLEAHLIKLKKEARVIESDKLWKLQ